MATKTQKSTTTSATKNGKAKARKTSIKCEPLADKNGKLKDVPKKSTIPQVSKALQTKVDKIAKFEEEKAQGVEHNDYQKLLHVSNKTTVATFNLSQALKMYLNQTKGEFTPKVMQCLTMKNVIAYIKESKYRNLSLYTYHQITLICNAVIKEHNRGIAQLERAAKQQAKVDKI